MVGINYFGQHDELRGCVNDADHMVQLLESKRYDVVRMCDDDARAMPTGGAIIRALYDLVMWTKGGASREVFFHFSGHGGSIRDQNGDERDGRDECLFACDRRKLRDDTIAKVLALLPSDARMFIQIDACHSGSMCDLPFHFGAQRHRGTHISGNVIMLSGCMDTQTSSDAYGVTSDTWQGAMTATTIQCLRYATTLNELVSYIRWVLKKKGYRQIPQLTSSRPLLMHEKPTAFL